MKVWGVVVAGGEGTRFGRRKQFARLGDRRVIERSLDALRPFTEGLIAVVPPDLLNAGEPVGELAVEPLAGVGVVSGGSTRSASVRAGLARLGPDATHVLIHDAARPLADADLVCRVVDALAAGAGAVVPVIPVTDSLRERDGGPVDRERFVAVQTPQGFRVDVVRAAHEHGGEASDDATLVDRTGGSVRQVVGDPRNLKLTDRHDLAVAELLLGESTTAEVAEAADPGECP